MKIIVALVALIAVLLVAVSGAPAASRANTVTYNVSYGAQSWQKVDVYRPAAGANLPMVMVVHGGSWISGNKGGVAQLAQDLANAGIVAVAVDYRLASSTVVGYYGQVGDVRLATAWAIAHAAEYGGNGARMGLLGSSAGGNLVGLSSLDDNWNQAGKIKAVATLSAPNDLVPMVASANANNNPATGSGLPEFLGCALKTCPLQTQKNASPRYHANPTCPAFYILHGSAEFLPLTQATDFASALRASKCSVEQTVVQGTLHAQAYWPQVSAGVVAYFVRKL